MGTTVDYSYQSGGGDVNVTGSQDYGARVRIVGDAGSGCSSNPYQQFNTSAFQGPPVGSVGLESGDGYMRSCFTSILDLSLSRTFGWGGAILQLRVDVFNAPNAAAITDRNRTMNLTEPERPGDGDQSPVRRERQPDPLALAAARRRVWRGTNGTRTRGPCSCRCAFSF